MVTFQIVVVGVAASKDGADWGIVAVGLTDAGPTGRAHVLADASGRISSGEAGRRVAELSVDGRVSVAVLANGAEDRFAGVLAMAARAGYVVPPIHPLKVGDASGLWTGALKAVYEAGRVAHVAGLGDLEEALRTYRPGSDAESPRVSALLAAVSYLREIGGLQDAGSPWTDPLRSPEPIDALHVSGAVDKMSTLRRLGAGVE